MEDSKVLFPIFPKEEGDGSEIIPLSCAGMGLTGIRLDLKEQPDGRVELYDPSHESRYEVSESRVGEKTESKKGREHIDPMP